MGAMDYLTLKLAASSISQEQRDEWRAKGFTLSKDDDSFPIPNTDFLKRAIQSIGRAPEGKRASVKAHIIARAKALKATDLLPEGWLTPAKE